MNNLNLEVGMNIFHHVHQHDFISPKRLKVSAFMFQFLQRQNSETALYVMNNFKSALEKLRENKKTCFQQFIFVL